MIAFVARQVRRLIALIALAAMLIGAPYALYKLGGPLLPDHVPGLAEIWQRLTERDTGQVFLGFLVIVGFVAWAIFTITVLMEIVSRIARRPDWHLPGLHLPQSAAGLLVGMLIAGTIATSATPAIAASMPLLPHPAPLAVAASPFQSASPAAHRSQASMMGRPTTPIRTARAAAAGPTWTVTKGDSLWSIAEKTLGSGRRYHEIAALNEGRVQPDGRTLESANFLLPGWILQLPAGAHIPEGQGGSPATGPTTAGRRTAETVIVEPGDTLSQIALDELGNANLYPELAAVNHIANADLIHPGQTIHIPAPEAPARSGTDGPQRSAGTTSDGSEAGPSAAAHQADDATAPAHEQAGASNPGEATASGVSGPDAQSDGAGSSEVDPAEGAAAPDPAAASGDGSSRSATAPSSGATAPSDRASSVAPNSSAPAATEAGPSASSSQETRTPVAGASETGELLSQRNMLLAGVTTLTAAIAWAGLLLTRRRLEQSRRPGQRTPQPPTELEARAEGALRRRASRSTPERINRALRTITPILAKHGDVGIVGVLIDTDSIELLPAKPTPPPEPFTGSNTAWTMQLPEATPDVAIDYEKLAALPAIATVGTTSDGRIAMINLEQIGALHIGGDQQRAGQLINHLILELSQSPWTDGIHLNVADRADGMRALDTDRIQTVKDLAFEVKALAVHTKSIRELLRDERISKTRTETAYADAWEPHVLIADERDIAAVEASADLIKSLQAGPPAAAALITSGPNPGIATSVEITADGTAMIPTIFGREPITIAGTTDDEFAALIGLFAAELDTDETATDEDATHEDAIDFQRLGILTTDVTVDFADGSAEVNDVTPDVEIDGAAAVLADGMPYATNGTVTIEARDRPKQPGGLADGDVSRDPDRRLDDDLAEWQADTMRRPKIAILGPARVTGRGPAPSKPQPRQVEIAVYLALYAQGVTADKFITDLWPDGAQPSAGGRRVVVSRLRAWLGQDPESAEPFIPHGDSGYYLTDRLLDSELFARLVRRSERRSKVGDARDALEDLQRALELVRGPVLPEAGGQAYSWMAAAGRLEDRTLPMAVIDAAHAATDLALAIGDVAIAESAAMTGRRIEPYSVIPLCDLIHIAQYGGDSASAASWAKAVLAVSDVDLPEDLPKHMQKLVGDALPKPRRRPFPDSDRR